MKQRSLLSPASRSNEGFSMIELLVVATIMIVLATIGLVSYQRVGVTSRDGKRKADLEIVRQALVLYKIDSADGEYPSSLNWGSMSPIQDYVSANTVSDPKPSPYPAYTYSYDSSDNTFSLCATLEVDSSSHCVTNP
ncbi:MAG TPA: type II secretion system protein [Vitreimonas sp.]|nr:type II secretion system protein [Vitreimonas sp.]